MIKTEIEELIDKITSMTNLASAIDEFVDKLIETKKITISVNDYTPNEILTNEKIISIVGEKYVINNPLAIAIKVIEKYKKKFSFDFQEDFKLNSEFLNKIEQDFDVRNFRLLRKELWKITILESNNQYKSNFHDFINSFNKEDKPKELYDFISVYNLLLVELDITSDMLYANSLKLLELNQKEVDVNISYNNILFAIKQKCFDDESVGLELLKIALQENSLHNENIISSIVTGLYDKIGYAFYKTHLKDFVESNKFQKGIFTGLSCVKNITEIESKIFINLFDTYKNFNDLIFSLLQLLFSILSSKDFENKQSYISPCFDRVSKAVEDEKVVYFVINEVVLLEEFEVERINLIIKIVNQSYFNIEKHLKSICQIFWYIKDVETFKKILISLAKNNPFTPVAKYFESSFSYFDKKELDRILVELLINNKANIRFVAKDIFNNLSQTVVDGYGYVFSYNILKLESIDQYKLCISLYQEFREPKFIVPALLPLFDSKSDTIKEIFIAKLEECSENYGGHLLETLEKFINNSSKHIEITNRIKTYMNHFYEVNANVKNDIKELNPIYTHNKLFNDYNLFHWKNMNKSINNAEMNSPFLNLIGNNTIILAKGGGWKTGNKTEISKLAEIRTSFALPRSYFINPNKFDIEEWQRIINDWKDEDFEIVKKFISNEQ
ncbi:hypothetical protein [Apibacter adventoris]|uniref:Uncharacterized protein n=1 Tax=Apibacter adventoris TaxID=1679466 RepID=A0A2S8AB25_9FLAO|nr:hypothetical protein [Apibacter adventoris]PQL91798.1 hypothetical protein C4S77_08340 [Apibacter adventoris]